MPLNHGGWRLPDGVLDTRGRDLGVVLPPDVVHENQEEQEGDAKQDNFDGGEKVFAKVHVSLLSCNDLKTVSRRPQ